MRWALLAVMLLLLAPSLAQAAHTHDHRYMVAGRVLDDEGLPAGQVGLRVELVGAEGFVPAEAPRTNCQGDFLAVFDLDQVPADAEARVTVQGETFSKVLDPTVRRSFFKINASSVEVDPSCDPFRARFGSQHVVTLRLLDPAGQPLEGAPVEMRLELASGQPLTGNATTNAAGDVAVGFQSERLNQGGKAVISARGDVWEAPLDTTFHITVADHVASRDVPSPSPALLVGLLGLAGACLRRRS
ncbi:MAG: hypothetical protein R3185_00220 [Candidatus Thermoplasmatota archaeon]|nr:hypothetical protein [Candidatus Thermoplasmatota archaeon]